MAGGLGGLGGFDIGGVLGALGQSLLVSPRENPFQGLPAALQATAQQREHQASLAAMASVAQKFGIPKEIAANPLAMQLYIQQANLAKLNAARMRAAQGVQLMPPDDDSSQPALSVPGLTGAGGAPQSFNLEGGVGAPAGGLGGLGGLGGAGDALPKPASFTQRGGLGGTRMTLPVDPSLAPAIAKYSAEAGLNPVDVATAMSYETGGTFDPWKRGPTTKWGTHRGLIQWGEPQARDYGVTKNTPVDEQVKAAIEYLQDRGVKPGMGLLDIYSAINAGGVGRYNASDAGAGGAPGTVRDKVNNQMAGHRQKAQALLSSVDLTNIVPTPLGGPSPTAVAGQSNAPFQVAAAGKAIPVPLPDTTLPPPPALPPPGASGNRTKAYARNLFQQGMNMLATSNGDPVLMKQAEVVLQRASKYGDPSDMAKRLQEAGLLGTPAGRAALAGFPTGTVEKLAEQLIPGYESPGTLEQRKFLSAQDQQAWQRNETETARRQQERLAQEGHRIQLMSDEEKRGGALNEPMRALNVQAGTEARQRQITAEARTRDLEAARVKVSSEITAGARAAEALVAPVRDAQQALEKVVELGGYGPLNSVPGVRALAAIPGIPGASNQRAHAAEVARQEFEQAMSTIGKRVAAMVNKEQSGGNMNKTEQELARADLAKLNSADPEIARKALRKFNEDIDRAMELDRRLGVLGGEQQTPRESQAAPAPGATPAKDGWIDFGNGVRVRRK